MKKLILLFALSITLLSCNADGYNRSYKAVITYKDGSKENVQFESRQKPFIHREVNELQLHSRDIRGGKAYVYRSNVESFEILGSVKLPTDGTADLNYLLKGL